MGVVRERDIRSITAWIHGCQRTERVFRASLREPSVHELAGFPWGCQVSVTGFGDSKSHRHPHFPPSQTSIFLHLFSLLFCISAGFPGGDGIVPGPARGVTYYPSPEAAILTWDGDGVGARIFRLFTGGLLLLPHIEAEAALEGGQLIVLYQCWFLSFDRCAIVYIRC